MRTAVYDTKSYDRESLLAAAGADQIEWVFHPFRLSVPTAAASEGMNAVCVFVNDHVDAESLRQFDKMGVGHLALRCAGFNNVDLRTAQQLDIPITRVPAYSPHAVAEHTVGLLLTLNRRIHRAYNRVRELNFSLSGLVGFDLFGKTAGIVGTGKIGALTAQILRGFGMEVLAYDPFPRQEWAQKYGISYRPLQDLLETADILSLHVPLLPETRHMINADSLSAMKRGALLLNVSRGDLVDTGALIEALKSGQLGGVGLDVYEEEEGIFFEDLSGEVLQDDELARLLTFPNVLITSHQAFLTREALNEISRVTVENILRIHRGEAPLTGTQLGVPDAPGPNGSRLPR
ncbi:MAG: 2-hydroxyacid dehydrogenase [Kiritimatiellia bacterium]